MCIAVSPGKLTLTLKPLSVNLKYFVKYFSKISLTILKKLKNIVFCKTVDCSAF